MWRQERGAGCRIVFMFLHCIKRRRFSFVRVRVAVPVCVCAFLHITHWIDIMCVPARIEELKRRSRYADVHKTPYVRRHSNFSAANYPFTPPVLSSASASSTSSRSSQLPFSPYASVIILNYRTGERVSWLCATDEQPTISSILLLSPNELLVAHQTCEFSVWHTQTQENTQRWAHEGYEAIKLCRLSSGHVMSSVLFYGLTLWK